MFYINPGDTLILLADAAKGMALERLNVFSKIADAILSGKGRELYPTDSEEDNMNFAKIIKDIKQEGDEQ